MYIYTVAVCSAEYNGDMAFLRAGSGFYFKVCVNNPHVV